MKRSHFLFSILLFFTFPPFLAPSIAADANPDAGPSFTATAILQIHHSAPHYLAASEQKYDAAEFESCKLTQAELVKAPFVINAALRNTSEIIKNQPTALPNLRREEKAHHAIAWLGKKLHVRFPSPGSEIMKISLTLSDAEESATLLNAVVKAYFDEVVNVERLQKKRRYSDLQTFSAENENALRTKRTELRQLAENLGTTDGQSEGFAEKLENEKCMQIQSELTRMKFDYAARNRRIAELTILIEQNQAEAMIPLEVAAYLQQASTEYRELLQKKSHIDQVVREGVKELHNVNPDHYPPSLTRSRDDLAFITNRIDELQKDAEKQVRIGRRIALERELKQLQNGKQPLENQIVELKAEYEKTVKFALEQSRTSIDVQMKQAEINNLERLLQSVNSEKDQLRIELKAAPRIEIVGDQNNPADVPESPDPRKKKKTPDSK